MTLANRDNALTKDRLIGGGREEGDSWVRDPVRDQLPGSLWVMVQPQDSLLQQTISELLLCTGYWHENDSAPHFPENAEAYR